MRKAAFIPFYGISAVSDYHNSLFISVNVFSYISLTEQRWTQQTQISTLRHYNIKLLWQECHIIVKGLINTNYSTSIIFHQTTKGDKSKALNQAYLLICRPWSHCLSEWCTGNLPQPWFLDSVCVEANKKEHLHCWGSEDTASLSSVCSGKV